MTICPCFATRELFELTFQYMVKDSHIIGKVAFIASPKERKLWETLAVVNVHKKFKLTLGLFERAHALLSWSIEGSDWFSVAFSSYMWLSLRSDGGRCNCESGNSKSWLPEQLCLSWAPFDIYNYSYKTHIKYRTSTKLIKMNMIKRMPVNLDYIYMNAWKVRKTKLLKKERKRNIE